MGGVYAFGECEFHVDQRLLLRVGKPLPLGGRALDLLMLLVAQRHRTVGKQELIDHCWPDQAVEPNNLAVQVWMLLLFLLGVFGPQAGVVASAGWALLMLPGLASAAYFQRGFDLDAASPHWQPEVWAR